MLGTLTAASIVVVLVAALAVATQDAEAKGRFLDVYPKSTEWGETVYLDGFNFPGETVELYARFAPTRAELTSAPPGQNVRDADVDEDGMFLAPVVLKDIPGATLAPGWVEFVARAEDGPAVPSFDMSAQVMVTSNGQRPADAGFVEGRISPMSDQSPGRLYVVWAPASDILKYRSQFVGDAGFYRTDYLEDGEWLVGPVDVRPNSETLALGSSLETITAQPPDLNLDFEVTWRYRRVTVRDGQPVAGVDFDMADK
ncbi:MAG: hypothetical protein Q8S13_08925, partial [Dehalococcoidia bacterium]|nr:hypothetical protein [Dehalococcoidia bacterium]